MAEHILTKTFRQLRGFNTNSIFARPSQVADKVVNMLRQPDGTFSPRRGSQVQTAFIGGLGLGVFFNGLPGVQTQEELCIGTDGNLYRKVQGILDVSYFSPGGFNTEYLQLQIYVDPNQVSDTAQFNFNPYEVINTNALISDRILLSVSKVTQFSGVAIGAGAQTYVGVLGGAPIQPGTITMTDGVLTVTDNGFGQFIGNVGIGANAINYTTGSYSVTFSAVTGAVTASYLSTLQIQAGFPYNLGRGFQVNPQFINFPIGSAAATYVGTLMQPPIQPGSIIMTDGTLTVKDNGIGQFVGNIGVGTNTINYATGAYNVTFSGVTGTVTATYSSAIIPNVNNVATAINTVTGAIALLDAAFGNQAQLCAGAFLDVIEPTTIANNQTIGLNFYYWQPVNRTQVNTFLGLALAVNRDFFQNATMAAFTTNMFIATKFDPLYKYDGQTVYLAGVPQPAAPGLAVGGAGNVNAGNHDYEYDYVQVDAGGNIVEGIISPLTTATAAPGGSMISVTVNNLLAGSGFNTDCGLIAAPQVAVNTINLVAGNTLQVGDKAFFIDSANNPQTRNVTASTNTSITIDGAPVSVTNATAWQTPISNNLKINIYRTPAGISAANNSPDLLVTIPNNSFAATTVYVDNIADANLGIAYPFFNGPLHGQPPPNCGIVFAFNNILILAQDQINDDFVWFSQPNRPEYIDPVFGKFLVPANSDDVNGVGVSGSTLIIFKTNSIYSINGDLNSSQFSVLPVSPGSNIGCASHFTIQSKGSLLTFLSEDNGVFTMAETTLFPVDKFGSPVPISIDIDQFFRQSPTIQKNKQYVLKRATAINFETDHQYILFLPCEEDGGDLNIVLRNANDFSTTLVYDYLQKNWFWWTGVNAAGGFYTLGSDLYWQERKSLVNTISANTNKQHRKYRLIDQVDHVTPIRVTWASSWEAIDEPRVRKKFTRATLLFDNISSYFQLNLPTMYFYSYKDWNGDLPDTMANIITKLEVTQTTFPATPVLPPPVYIPPANWAIMPWAFRSWGGYQDSFLTVPLKKGTVAKALQMALQLNVINTSFQLQGFQLEVAADFRKTIVR